MNKKLIPFAKNLRKNATDVENKLWFHLRSRKMAGFKFRRQHPIGKYIVDFVCLEKNLVIELDGGQHATDRKRDKERDEWMSGEGFKILRIWNTDVLEDIEAVLELIRQNCLSPSPLSPPLKGGEY